MPPRSVVVVMVVVVVVSVVVVIMVVVVVVVVVVVIVVVVVAKVSRLNGSGATISWVTFVRFTFLGTGAEEKVEGA